MVNKNNDLQVILEPLSDVAHEFELSEHIAPILIRRCSVAWSDGKNA